MDYVNKKEIRVFGLKRSGNHAVIHWIANNCRKACILNGPRLDTNIFTDLRDSHFYKNNCLFQLDLEKERKGQFAKKNVLIYNRENLDLRLLSNKKIEKNHDNFIGKSKVRYDALILRDPFNLFASTLKRFCEKPDNFFVKKYFDEIIDRWKQYALEYLGKTNYLKNKKVVINYNTWVRSKKERQKIGKKFKITIKNSNINYILGFGGGSSFDKKRLNGCAKQMKVLQRWRNFSKNELYKSFFDDEVVVLSKKIFGLIPGTECIYVPKKNSIIKEKYLKAKIKIECASLAAKYCIPVDFKDFSKKYAFFCSLFSERLPILYQQIIRMKNVIFKTKKNSSLKRKCLSCGNN
jgi:hypothetical protein